MDKPNTPVYYYEIQWLKQIEDKMVDYIEQIKPLVLAFKFLLVKDVENGFSDDFGKYLKNNYFYDYVNDVYLRRNCFRYNDYITFDGKYYYYIDGVHVDKLINTQYIKNLMFTPEYYQKKILLLCVNSGIMEEIEGCNIIPLHMNKFLCDYYLIEGKEIHTKAAVPNKKSLVNNDNV